MPYLQFTDEQRAEACRQDRDVTHAQIDAYAGPLENARVARVRSCRGSLSLLMGRFDEARERYAAARAALGTPKVIRCAECTCGMGGEDCSWIASSPEAAERKAGRHGGAWDETPGTENG